MDELTHSIGKVNGNIESLSEEIIRLSEEDEEKMDSDLKSMMLEIDQAIDTARNSASVEMSTAVAGGGAMSAAPVIPDPLSAAALNIDPVVAPPAISEAPASEPEEEEESSEDPIGEIRGMLAEALKNAKE
jgi:hypothetical protein